MFENACFIFHVHMSPLNSISTVYYNNSSSYEKVSHIHTMQSHQGIFDSFDATLLVKWIKITSCNILTLVKACTIISMDCFVVYKSLPGHIISFLSQHLAAVHTLAINYFFQLQLQTITVQQNINYNYNFNYSNSKKVTIKITFGQFQLQFQLLFIDIFIFMDVFTILFVKSNWNVIVI